MKIEISTVKLECFTHIDEDTGKQTTYAVAAINEYVDGLGLAHSPLPVNSDDMSNGPDVQLYRIPVERHHAEYCYANRGVEQHRLRWIFEAGPHTLAPIVFIKLPENKMLLVDGTHRYIAAAMLGHQAIDAYVVPWSVGEQFIVDGVPQVDPAELLASHSGF